MNVNLKVVAFLLTLAATVFAIILGVSVGSGEYFYPSLALAGFAGLFLVSNPPIAAACAVATFSSGVTLPGLPGQMRLFDVFALALIGIFVLNSAMKSGKRVPFSRLDWVVIIFSGWIFFIGSYRGFGFLSFGAEMIGGFNYLRILLAASLVITLPRIGVPSGSWKTVFLFLGILAPATLVADLMVMRGWDFTLVRVFVQASSQLSEVSDDPQGIGRLLSAGPAASGMLLSFLCLIPLKRCFEAKGIVWLTLFAAIVVVSLLSGYRLMTASLVVISVLALYFQRGFTVARMLALSIAACVGLAVVYIVAPDLPLSVQRTISWLPGIEISSVASGDASETVDWRFRLWHEALRYIPDYWLIGKGFSYNKLDFIAANQMIYSDDLRWALVSGSYHNGWISMLLCTGVFGTILCLILLIAPLRRHWKRQFSPWRNALLKRFHGVFLASFAAAVGIFFVVYGEVHTSFPGVFFYLAVLETLSRADAESTSDVVDDHEGSADYAESTYQEA